jgi:hypothetical protein
MNKRTQGDEYAGRSYSIPSEIVEDKLRTQAHRRREALLSAGCSTYTIGLRGGQQAIVCCCCGLGSNHPDDVANRYCGFCHEWHSEELI